MRRPNCAMQSLGRAAPTHGERELLRAALLPDQRAGEAWSRWLSVTNIDTAPLRAYDLLPAVAANVSPAGLGAEGDRLRGLRRRVWATNQLLLASAAEAIGVLNELDLEVVLAKGGNLVSSVYEIPGVRPMLDVDIVVGPDHLDAACQALVARGWSYTGARTVSQFGHAVSLVDAHGHGIDVHRWLMFPRFSRIEELGWYARAEQSSLRGRPIRRLTLADELVLTVAHGLMTKSPSTARWPVDVAHLARAFRAAGDPNRYWDAVLVSARELQIAPVVGAGLAAASESFEIPVPASLIAALRGHRLDPLVEAQWQLRRAGGHALMRPRRYADMERVRGRRPTVAGYVSLRRDALRKRGVREVLIGRARTVAPWLARSPAVRRRRRNVG